MQPTHNDLFDLNHENEDIAAIFTFPLLFPPTIRSSVKSKNYRPSKLEVQESFILHVRNSNDIRERIEKRREVVYKNNWGIQPFIIVVGDLNQIEASYCYVDDHLYLLDSPLKALDVTFKICYALNAKYAPESYHVWTYIQKHIYEISSVQDKEYGTIESLHAALTKY